VAAGQGALHALLLGAAGAAQRLAEVAAILAERQLDPPAREEVLELEPSALEAFLRTRDPFAALLSPRQYEALSGNGPVTPGIGVELVASNGGFLLVPYPDGPARDAGLENRCLLLQVDGRSVAGLAIDRVGELLRGAPGSTVRLDVRDLVTGRTRQFSVTRGHFTAPAAAYLREEEIALVRVWTFRSRDTLLALERGIRRLREEGAELVIDLRGAQGGDLFEALDAASLFVDGGRSLAMVEDNRERRRELVSLPGRRITRRPVLLLVGRNTASAAEAFARALRHYGAARLVGENTYGKCLTQTLVPLRDGGALKFSNGRLLGPEGTPCEDGGLRPDTRVPRPDRLSARALLAEALSAVQKKSPRGAGANH
jgi:carboxyl-terminal processing protease